MSIKNQSALLRSVTLPLLFAAVAFSANSDETKPVKLPPEVKLPIVVEIERPRTPMRGDLYDFLNAIGHRESSNRYDVVNRYGYMGRYQFSRRTLFSLGEEFQVDRKTFLNTPELQDSAMVAYLRQNRQTLFSLIREYNGRTINGVKITESGLLAGAHLVGPAGVKAFFDSNYLIRRNGKEIRPRTEDGNGIQVSQYISTFSGYDLNLGD